MQNLGFTSYLEEVKETLKQHKAAMLVGAPFHAPGDHPGFSSRLRLLIRSFLFSPADFERRNCLICSFVLCNTLNFEQQSPAQPPPVRCAVDACGRGEGKRSWNVRGCRLHSENAIDPKPRSNLDACRRGEGKRSWNARGCRLHSENAIDPKPRTHQTRNPIRLCMLFVDFRVVRYSFFAVNCQT
jgi:hypothetical protein